MTEFSWLSIVVPAHNEEATIEAVLTRLSAAFPGAELLMVDNNSTDATLSRSAALPGVLTLSERCPGKGHAMRAGASLATRPWLMFHDADVEYAPEDAVAVALAAREHGGMCVGNRLTELGHTKISSWLANHVVCRLLERRFGTSLCDALSGTRVMPTRLFLDMDTRSPGFSIETEITRKVLESRIPIHTRPVRYVPRSFEEGKKIRFYHMRLLLWEALRSG